MMTRIIQEVRGGMTNVWMKSMMWLITSVSRGLVKSLQCLASLVSKLNALVGSHVFSLLRIILRIEHCEHTVSTVWT